MLRRTFCISASAACASSLFALTVLRMRPQKSNSQEASNGSEYSVVVNGLEFVDAVRSGAWWERVTEGSIVTVGKYWERFCFTTARAERKVANDEATV